MIEHTVPRNAKLPVPDWTQPGVGKASGAPRTPTETRIAEIWQEVLGVERVGVYDNFFELGGHSLLSMQVVARIEKQLGLRIHPKELVLQTLGQLSAACQERLTAPQRSQQIGLVQKLLQGIKAAAHPTGGV